MKNNKSIVQRYTDALNEHTQIIGFSDKDKKELGIDDPTKYSAEPHAPLGKEGKMPYLKARSILATDEDAHLNVFKREELFKNWMIEQGWWNDSDEPQAREEKSLKEFNMREYIDIANNKHLDEGIGALNGIKAGLAELIKKLGIGKADKAGRVTDLHVGQDSSKFKEILDKHKKGWDKTTTDKNAARRAQQKINYAKRRSAEEAELGGQKINIKKESVLEEFVGAILDRFTTEGYFGNQLDESSHNNYAADEAGAARDHAKWRTSPEGIKQQKKRLAKDAYHAYDPASGIPEEEFTNNYIKKNTVRMSEGEDCKVCNCDPCICEKTNEDLLCKKCEKDPCVCEGTSEIHEMVNNIPKDVLLEIWTSIFKPMIKTRGSKNPYGITKPKSPETVSNRNDITRIQREYKEAINSGDEGLTAAYKDAAHAAHQRNQTAAAVRQQSKDKHTYEILTAKAKRAQIEFERTVKIADDLNPRLATTKVTTTTAKPSVDGDYLDSDAFKDFEL